MIKSPMYSPPPRPRHRRKPRVRPHPGLRHLGPCHRRRYGCIIMRITGISQPHRAFRQSADAKLTVPEDGLDARIAVLSRRAQPVADPPDPAPEPVPPAAPDDKHAT